MKKAVCAALMVTLLGAASATAADITSPASYDWTGFYVGANGGFGTGSNSWGAPSLNIYDTPGSFGGLLGGVTLGANWQLNRVVFGVDGDFDFASLKATNSTGNGFSCPPAGCTTAVNSLATARVRLGYAIGERALIYATGGLAGGYAHAYATGYLGGQDLGSANKIGWTAGAGVETALTDRITARLEGLYVDLGRLDIPTACGGPCATDVRFFTARVGVDYKF